MFKLPRPASIGEFALSGRKAVPALFATAALTGLAVFALDRPPQAIAFDNTYVVEAGDVLGALAIELGIADEDIDAWIDQVVLLNGLPDAHTIVEGQTLSLPIGSAPPIQDASTAATGSLIPIAEPETYTVQAGDTLLGIAVSLGVSDEMAWIDEVVSLNGLESADLITAGQLLQLPVATHSGASDDTTATGSDTGMAGESTDSPSTYTVQGENDNLFDLAASIGIPDSEVNAWVEATVALNSLDVNGLYPGDVIDLPQPGTY